MGARYVCPVSGCNETGDRLDDSDLSPAPPRPRRDHGTVLKVLSAFWNGVSGKLAERWMARLVTPALLFWGIGWLAWCWSERPPSARGNGVLTDLGDALQYRAETFGRLSGPERIAWIVAVLLAIAGSAVVAERLTAPFLGWIEGYWPGGLPRWLWRLLVRLSHGGAASACGRNGAACAGSRVSSPQDTTRQATLAGRLHGMPPDEAVMPTALGNILRASELRSARRYGLDPVIAWPRGCGSLAADATRQEIAGSRGQLDAAGRGVLWASQRPFGQFSSGGSR